MTPSERIYSWAKYLKHLGFYPIIVTRNWDFTITGFSDELKSSGTEPIHEKFEDYEVWYMPYKQSFKESLYTESPGLKKSVYKLFSVFTSILQIFTYKFSPFQPLLKKCDELLNNDKEIDYLIVSAYPHAFFNFAYLLNKKHKIKWVADYRDDWTSNEIINRSKLHQLLNYFNSFNEKKWLSTSAFFITVSDYYVKKIRNVIGNIPGYCVLNGYLEENYTHLIQGQYYESFTITYVGSLYYTQPIELFLDGVKKFIQKQQVEKFKVIFVGIKNNVEAYQRILNNIHGFEKYFDFTSRVNKMEAIEIQHKSDLLLICTHTNMKGTPGSKLYEYIALQKPILITPGDDDIVESTLKETNQAKVAKNVDEVCEQIEQQYMLYLSQNRSSKNFNFEMIKKYNRYNQTVLLAQLLKKY